MKPFNSVEFNTLCAKFLGWRMGHKDKDEKRWSDNWFDRNEIRHERLSFETDWNWLMKVIEQTLIYCQANDCMEEHYYPITDAIPDKQSTVRVIWEFLNSTEHEHQTA